MRKLALFSLLILSSIGLAQDMPPAKEIVISQKVFMIFRPAVKKELKITDDQEKRAKDAFGDILQVDGDRIMITMTGDTDLKELGKNALKVLDADQTKRLKEVWIQEQFGTAIADDEVAKELALTDDQRKSADKEIESAGQALMEMFQGGDHGPEMAKKALEVRKKAGEKMLALLTEEQKKKYEAMKGKPFKSEDGG